MSKAVAFLLDISALFWRLWHVSSSKERGWAVNECLGRCQNLARQYQLFTVCADAPGPTWRHQLIDAENALLAPDVPRWPAYKGTRQEKDADAIAELKRLLEEVKKLGFTFWQCPGFEGDDVIATAAIKLAARGDRVFIGGADKDLCQLVMDSITFVRLYKNGDSDTLPDEWGPEEVHKKFGVWPAQLAEYLAIVGDKSDNLPHVNGLGEAFAIAMLTQHDTLKRVYEHVRAGWAGVEKAPTEAGRQKLAEGEKTIHLALRLAQLRTDAPIDLAELKPWTAPATTVREQPKAEARSAAPHPEDEDAGKVVEEIVVGAAPAANTTQTAPATTVREQPKAEDPRAPSLLDQIADATKAKGVAEGWIGRSFQERLEPKNLRETWWMAETLDRAEVPGKGRNDPPQRLYAKLGNKQAIFAVIVKAAELNIPAMLGLAHIRVVEGKAEVDAMLMIALALRSGRVEYVRCVESNDASATYETKHVNTPAPQRVTFTVEDAKKAGLIPANEYSPWTKYRRVMLRWRAASELLRMACPEAVAGLYVRGEIDELDEDDVRRGLRAEAA